MPAKRKPRKRNRPDPNFYKASLAKQTLARRAVCSALGFWRYCGHKPCLRTKACALETNDCFGLLWPQVPQRLKIAIHAGIEAKVAGLPPPEIKAAIARAEKRWDDTQAPFVAETPAPEPVESRRSRRLQHSAVSLRPRRPIRACACYDEGIPLSSPGLSR